MGGQSEGVLQIITCMISESFPKNQTCVAFLPHQAIFSLHYNYKGYHVTKQVMVIKQKAKHNKI